VERHAAGRRVTAVFLQVGHLRQVVPASLAFYFEHVARGTVCEGARLEQELVPARLRCRCGHQWEVDGIDFRCAACGGERRLWRGTISGVCVGSAARRRIVPTSPHHREP
jgi:hydrogenase nickel incorporation protein HypA/HybF